MPLTEIIDFNPYVRTFFFDVLSNIIIMRFNGKKRKKENFRSNTKKSVANLVRLYRDTMKKGGQKCSFVFYSYRMSTQNTLRRCVKDKSF